ncbi:HAMP domain-containing sensor histidine kinase [Streptomyces sp. B6B3]|uniref:sensor histidine kinase n=1 Tax=Streptomyces sp. B6B3 TaxID=3153570 RepID=UPI00325C9789
MRPRRRRPPRWPWRRRSRWGRLRWGRSRWGRLRGRRLGWPGWISGRGGLTGDIVLLTITVAAVAVLLTGVVAWYMLRTSAEAQGREELARRAEVLSRTPAMSSLLLDREQRITGFDDVLLALITPTGMTTGPAAPAVGDDTRATLLAGYPVATTATLDGRQVLLAGHPARNGSAVVLTQPLSTVSQATDRMRGALAWPLGAGLAGAALAGALLARRLARPLVTAAQVAHRLAEGERGLRLAPDGPAELVELAEALGALDTALARSENRQREFLLSVSHELRTPLTIVQGYAEAFADGVVPPEDTAEVGRTVLAETRRLDRFVRELLDLARMEADDFRLEIHDVDLDALVTEAGRAWSGRCARHGVEFRLERPEHPVPVRTDGFRVRQLIDGLAENALRVTPAGGPLVLALHEEEAPPDPADAGDTPWGGARLEVRDGGPGLTEADVAVAFERGVLRARYRDSRPGGAGLGLAIAHRLATRLGATITAHAHGPEGGARFVVLLPPGPRPGPAAGAPRAGSSATRPA